MKIKQNSKHVQEQISYISQEIQQGNLEVASNALEAVFTDNSITSDLIAMPSHLRKRDLAQLFCLKGQICENKEEHNEAIEHYNKSVEYYQTITSNMADNKFHISGILYNVSVCHRKLNNIEKEAETLLQASFGYAPEKASKLSDFMNHRLGQIYFNLAANYEVQNMLDQSLQYFQASAIFTSQVKYEDPSLKTLQRATREAKSQVSNYIRAINGEPAPNLRTEKKDKKTSASRAPNREIEETKTAQAPNRSLSEAISNLQSYSININQGANPDRLWEHQKNCVSNVSEGITQGIKSGFCTMATGTGKTKTFDTIVKTMGTNTVVVVPTTLLVDQTVEALKKSSPHLDIGIVDGTRKRKGNNITVTTYQSLKSSIPKGVFKDANLIVLDEVHSCLSEDRMGVIECFQKGTGYEAASSSAMPPTTQPIIIGFTATEEFNTTRPKGSASSVQELLSHQFFNYSIAQGINDQVLSPCKIVEIELDEGSRVIQTIKNARKKKGTEAGDITERELEALNDRKVNRILPDLIANVLDPETNASLHNKSGLIYTLNISHAETISQELNEAFGDINYSRPLHSRMKEKERKAVLEKHKSGEIKTIVNVDVLTVGYDDPKLKYIIDFRPTSSQVRLTQTFGRITRKDNESTEPKTYIQLVIPELGQLEVKALFDGNKRLGTINHAPLVANTGKGDIADIGEHLYYKATFSNNQIQERGEKLTKNEEVIKPPKRVKTSHTTNNPSSTIDFPPTNQYPTAATTSHETSTLTGQNSYHNYSHDSAAATTYPWNLQEEGLDNLENLGDIDWETLFGDSFGAQQSSNAEKRSWTNRAGESSNELPSRPPTSSSWTEQVESGSNKKTTAEQHHTQSQSSSSWAGKVISNKTKETEQGRDFSF